MRREIVNGIDAEVAAACAAGDEFVVDYVRVYDIEE